MGAYYGISYIDLSKNARVVNILKTVRINYEGYTSKQVEDDFLVHKVHKLIYDIDILHLQPPDHVLRAHLFKIKSETARSQ